MWMQLLKAAGFPAIGDAFPRNWADTIREANPGGFWESELRRGINFQTNPDPKTGAYLHPEQTRRHAVKVFIPGLIRSDVAFIDRLIVTVRPWRQYVRSLNRLYGIEQAAHAASRDESNSSPPPPVFMSPIIEWWVENFSLISDIVTRRHRFYMVAYDLALESPEQTLHGVFDWLGDGDVGAAIREVRPALRTQEEDGLGADISDDSHELQPEVIETFDALYGLVREQRTIDQVFVDRLNRTNECLQERIKEAVKEVKERQRERRRFMSERKRTAPRTGIPRS